MLDNAPERALTRSSVRLHLEQPRYPHQVQECRCHFPKGLGGRNRLVRCWRENRDHLREGRQAFG